MTSYSGDEHHNEYTLRVYNRRWVYVWVRSLGRNRVKEREREKTGIDIKGKRKREGKGRTGKERGGRLKQVCGKEERVTLRSAPCQKERKERRRGLQVDVERKENQKNELVSGGQGNPHVLLSLHAQFKEVISCLYIRGITC